MRPRLRRLLSLWRKPPEPVAASTVTDEIAVRDDAAPDDTVRDDAAPDDSKRRLADAQSRLKQAVPPKEE